MDTGILQPDARWPRGRLAATAAGTALGLIVLSHLLWSSPGYRRAWLLAAAFLALAVPGHRAWLLWRRSGWPGALGCFRDRAARPEGRTSAMNASGSSGLWFHCILE